MPYIEKLEMKYFVLKMNDTIDLHRLTNLINNKYSKLKNDKIHSITVNDFAVDLLNCID